MLSLKQKMDIKKYNRMNKVYDYYIKLHKLHNSNLIEKSIFNKTEQFLRSTDINLQNLGIALIDKFNNN